MLSRNFAFFSSILGLVLINTVAGSGLLLVTTPVLIALIWMLSGLRYATYAFVFWIAIITPSLIQTSFVAANGALAALTAIGDFMGKSAGFRASLESPLITLILRIFYTPQGIYCFAVSQFFFDCWAAKKLAEKILKQVTILKRLHP